MKRNDVILSPFWVYDTYSVITQGGIDYFCRSNKKVRQYDLCDTAMQDQLLGDFLQLDSTESALNWIQQHGLIEDYERTDGDCNRSNFPVMRFLELAASIKWLKKFFDRLEHSERSGETEILRGWLRCNDFLGDSYCANFEPAENEIRNFTEVFASVARP